MTFPEILAPLFVQVALTFVLGLWLVSARTSALRRRETRLKEIALGQPNWPPRVQQISNCFDNQLQLPVLLYVLVALAMLTRKADLLFVVMAWIFVLTRLIHAAIHTTSNNVQQRFTAYLIGAIVLLLMWIIFAVRILLGVP